MYNTQIQNDLGCKVRENVQLTNTDKKPLPHLLASTKSMTILIQFHIG